MMSATLSEDKNQRDGAEEQLKQVKHFRKHAMCSWISMLKIGDLRSKMVETRLRLCDNSFCVKSDRNVPNRTLFHRFSLSGHFRCLNIRRKVMECVITIHDI